MQSQKQHCHSNALNWGKCHCSRDVRFRARGAAKARRRRALLGRFVGHATSPPDLLSDRDFLRLLSTGRTSDKQRKWRMRYPQWRASLCGRTNQGCPQSTPGSRKHTAELASILSCGTSDMVNSVRSAHAWQSSTVAVESRHRARKATSSR